MCSPAAPTTRIIGPLTVTDAANKTTTRTYNGQGELLTSTDAIGRTNTSAYDGNGYLQSLTGPVAGATFGCDGYGRVSSTTTPDACAVTEEGTRIDNRSLA